MIPMNSILVVEDAPNFLRWIAAALARSSSRLSATS